METIETLKQRDATETPLFLFECRMPSGSVERWSTHEIDVGGDTYRARVIAQSAFELKLSSEGADAASKMSITLANADAYFSQLERQVGFKGAQLTVRFTFVDMIAGFGNHGACREDESVPPPTEDIHDALLSVTGPGDFKELDGVAVPQCDYTWLPGNQCLSRSSFHPKDTGAVRQGAAVTSALVAMGYQ